MISITGRRLSLEEGEIERLYKVPKETLARLVELRLLRADTRVGSFYYELSHDTLVDPIREWRLQRERRRRKRVLSAVSVMGALVVVLGATVVWLALGEPLKETARRALIVALTPETTRQALARDLRPWAKIPAPPGGQFTMGCVEGDQQCLDREKPPHAVRIARGFEMMPHEVTREQYERFVNDIRSTWAGRWLLPDQARQPYRPESGHPAVDVSWFDAAIFCAVLGGRLPTEAEWEYAARGKNPGAVYPWGNDSYSGDQANASGTQGRDQWRETAPVGSFPANSFDLFDMAGNVWEWTASVYQADPYSSDGGRESSLSSGARVVRGGSWSNDPGLRASLRDDGPPSGRGVYFGFRCARDGSP